VTLTFYDLHGNELLNFDIDKTLSFSKRIDDLAFKPGIYFLSLSTEMGQLTRKVIVN